MDNNELHPSVREFKAFINRHPKLAASIRKSGRPWQEYYEKWALLGEDDPFWDDFKAEDQHQRHTQETGKQSEVFTQLKKLSENVDLDKIQNQAHQLSGTISTVQELIGQFQKQKQHPSEQADNKRQPNWFRD